MSPLEKYQSSQHVTSHRWLHRDFNETFLGLICTKGLTQLPTGVIYSLK